MRCMQRATSRSICNRTADRSSAHCSDRLLLYCFQHVIGTGTSIYGTIRIDTCDLRTLWGGCCFTAYYWQVPDRLAASGTFDRHRGCFRLDVFHP